jgi:hypothetical protein
MAVAAGGMEQSATNALLNLLALTSIKAEAAPRRHNAGCCDDRSG